MTIVHPAQPVNGLNPEDVFYAVDDLGTQAGYGFILYQYQPGLYPDCPVNLYFSLDGDPSARYLLFGALVARARILQAANPALRARLYTSISPADIQLKDFYLQNGFDCDETDNILQLTIPFGDGRIPMSCTVAPTPLHTWDEQQGLLYRLKVNEITFVDLDYLQSLMRMPHFMTLGLYRNAMQEPGHGQSPAAPDDGDYGSRGRHPDHHPDHEPQPSPAAPDERFRRQRAGRQYGFPRDVPELTPGLFFFPVSALPFRAG